MPNRRIGRARRRGAVDEALILLAEALLFAGLLILSSRLWSARENPYPKLAGELLNATPPDAEVFIVFPEPVRIEVGRLCYAGQCYSAPVQYVKGQAWWWAKAYRGSTYVAAQSGPSGGGVEPGLNATLTIQVARLDYRDQPIGPAPAGVPVKVDGATYYTDESGQVRLSAARGTHAVEVPSAWAFNGGWANMTFSGWSTGETSAAIAVDVRAGGTTVAAYYRDWRLLKVTWEPLNGGYVAVDGGPVPNGWSGWYRYSSSATLRAVPGRGYRFAKWMRGANGGSLADYSAANPITVTIDDGYEMRAVFELPPIVLTVQLYAVDAGGMVRGPAAGVPVTIDSRTYYTDASGQVRLTVQAGFHCVQVEPRALFDGGWSMYDFYKWWDGLTSFSRCLDLEQDATLTAYVWERRKLLVEWDPGGYVDYSIACQGPCLFWGSGSSWASLYCKYGGSAALQAVPRLGYRFAKWMRAVKDGPLQDYSTSNPLAVTVDNGYTLHAVFELVYATVTVQVRALDANGNDRGPVAGVQVRIGDKVCTTDASGRASAQVPATGQSVTVEILTTELYFNSGWGRYRFYSWSDGDTRTAKSVVVWGDATLTAYFWDERLVVARCEPPEGGYIWGDTGWLKYGTSGRLVAWANPGYRFAKWMRSVNGGPLQDYSRYPVITFTVDNGYEFVAVFERE
jgi:hypothetical protein